MKKIYLLLIFFVYYQLLCASELFINVHLIDSLQLSITTQASGFDIISGNKNSFVKSGMLKISASSRNLQINGTQYQNQIILKAKNLIAINNTDYDGEIHLTVLDKKQIRVINRINIENYLISVISAEMGGNSPLEALKAQAVAARTMTISMINNNKHAKDGYNLCSTTHCQVYKGTSVQTLTAMSAVKQTQGQILEFNGKHIEAFYSSHCGGITECSENLWRMKHEYLLSHIDSYCINKDLIPNWNQRNINWERRFDKNDIEYFFNVRKPTEMFISKRNEASRAEAVTIKASKEVVVNGQYEIRNTFNLPSTLFIIIKEGDNYIFVGNGYGHGVGMCQTGAIARANAGQDYREILRFYYTDLVKLEVRN